MLFFGLLLTTTFENIQAKKRCSQCPGAFIITYSNMTEMNLCIAILILHHRRFLFMNRHEFNVAFLKALLGAICSQQ